MFGRRVLALVAFAAAYAQAQLTITSPGPNDWWVANSVNTLAWTCDTSPYSTYTVVLTNSDTSILTAPYALIADVENFQCSYSVNAQQSTLAVSNSWTLSLANSQNSTDVYASTPFSIEAFGSAYPTSSSSASGTATGTSSGASASSTSTSGKTGAASANYIPVGMSIAAAVALGFVVA